MQVCAICESFASSDGPLMSESFRMNDSRSGAALRSSLQKSESFIAFRSLLLGEQGNFTSLSCFGLTPNAPLPPQQHSAPQLHYSCIQSLITTMPSTSTDANRFEMSIAMTSIEKHVYYVIQLTTLSAVIVEESERCGGEAWGEEYNACSSALCNFLHSPVTSSLLAPNIFLSTLFSKTLNLCSLSQSESPSFTTIQNNR
ncbi:hypothetical protein ANN_22944 [Periplaneta americana]|uniref:Uncharacterized protein n=1 Tax=Periplaneta americana TaxID=6978 RepID=A0ABQ8SJP5_PERAM|nr:hypothetical protein ANN_22944 [Periplaneta americana]